MNALATLMWKDLRASKTTFAILIAGALIIQVIAYASSGLASFLAVVGFIPAFQLPANIARQLKSDRQGHQFFLVIPLIRHKLFIGLSLFLVHLAVGIIVYLVYFTGLYITLSKASYEFLFPIIGELISPENMGKYIIWHMSGLVFWLGFATGLPLISLSFRRRGSFYAVLWGCSIAWLGIVLIERLPQLGIMTWGIPGLGLGIITLAVGLLAFERYAEL